LTTPVALDDAYTTNEDTRQSYIQRAATTRRGRALRLSEQRSLHGELLVALGPSCTPTLNYNSPDNYTTIISDGVDNTTVAITVNPVNDCRCRAGAGRACRK
jgi:hypothetical protein